MKPLILAVDSNRRNVELLGQFLSKEGYQVISANDLQEFEQALNEPAEISLALVDIAGFNRQIWELCQQLQARSIPFLIISPRQSATLQQESLEHGARSMLVKPLVIRELLRLVRSLLKD